MQQPKQFKGREKRASSSTNVANSSPPPRIEMFNIFDILRYLLDLNPDYQQSLAKLSHQSN
jgi:hypothetical protein